MLKKYLTGSAICTLLLLAGFSTQAQAQQPAPEPEQQVVPETDVPAEEIDVTTEEVEQFASAIRQMQQIQSDAQTEAAQVLETVGLSVPRFNEILETQANPQAQPTAEVTPEEQQTFDQAYAEISQIQENTERRMEEAIQAEGLEVERFNEIFAAVRQNPELRQEVERILRGANSRALS